MVVLCFLSSGRGFTFHKSREYIIKLGFDQHPDLNSTEKSHVEAHLESQLGKGLRQRAAFWVKLQRLWFRVSIYNPRRAANWYYYQSVTNDKPGFMLTLLVLSCKTWNVAKPGAWLARHPPGAQQSQDPSPILSMVLHILHSQQAVIHSHSQSGQCPGRLEATSEVCFVSEA